MQKDVIRTFLESTARPDHSLMDVMVYFTGNSIELNSGEFVIVHGSQSFKGRA
jgi:hypothetical protein